MPPLLLSYEIHPRTGKPALHVREGQLSEEELQGLEGELRRSYDRLARRDGQRIEVRTKLRAFARGPAYFRVHVARGPARNPALWLRAVEDSAWVNTFVGVAREVVAGLARKCPEAALEEALRECAGLSRVGPKRLALQLLTGYLEHMHHNHPAGLGIHPCECSACTLRKAAKQLSAGQSAPTKEPIRRPEPAHRP